VANPVDPRVGKMGNPKGLRWQIMMFPKCSRIVMLPKFAGNPEAQPWRTAGNHDASQVRKIRNPNVSPVIKRGMLP
jgi:hypothetical protein